MNKQSENPTGIDSLLSKWEESYKKGLLSFWMLLQLQQRPTYPFEMKALIVELSQGTISVEDNSIYRALKRFEELGVVASEMQPSEQGPDRRYYQLTPQGLELLQTFIRRNILVFQSEKAKESIHQVLSSNMEKTS